MLGHAAGDENMSKILTSPLFQCAFGKAGAVSLFVQELSVLLVNWPVPTAIISPVADSKPSSWLLPSANVRTGYINSQRESSWRVGVSEPSKKKVVLSRSLQALQK